MVLGTLLLFLLFCDAFETQFTSHQEPLDVSSASNRKYLIYDVNPGEGFNLRRDVFLRAANMVKRMRAKDANWIFVLPAWPHLYHWQSDLPREERVPWRRFFEIEAINSYVPTIEFEDFLKENGPEIEEIMYLQNYKDGWSDGQEWVEKIDVGDCNESPPYAKDEMGKWRGHFSGFNSDVYGRNFVCVSAQGETTLLENMLLERKNLKSVFVDRFETLLHADFGGKEFWNARRSLVFARHLKDEAEKFMAKNLPKKSDDKEKGLPYMAVHFRRKDMTWYGRKDVPTLKGAIEQLKPLLKKHQLDVLFLATDAPDKEVDVLRRDLPIVQYKPTRLELKELGDGGVAIVDQWIASHARYFIGSEPSTFSYRIHEERSLMGFSKESTYNRLCYDGDEPGDERCEGPSYWPPV